MRLKKLSRDEGRNCFIIVIKVLIKLNKACTCAPIFNRRLKYFYLLKTFLIGHNNDQAFYTIHFASVSFIHEWLNCQFIKYHKRQIKQAYHAYFFKACFDFEFGIRVFKITGITIRMSSYISINNRTSSYF